ncbi:MAG TPA: hypothetical protein PKW15_01295 [Alphaproteobacteria bacterium]|nr:hypothetical protein [Alphaproteobacteria bacterium]
MPALALLGRERLTTAELLYGLPDHPMLLQTYIWQDYDLAPKFPLLQKFITFWQRDLDGKLYSVTVSLREEIGAAKFTFYADEF